MMNFDYTPGNRQGNKVRLGQFWGFILALVLIGLAIGYGVKAHIKPSHPHVQAVRQKGVEPQAGQAGGKQVEVASSGIKQFDFLREVSFFGNRFLVLRHQPTAQRIVLLSSATGQDEACRILFSRQLGVAEFSTLIPIFKAGTQFEGSLIEVNKVSLDKQGQLVHRPYRMQYKHYLISILQDKKPRLFETYIGRIDKGSVAQALVMTFNSAHYGTMAPFEDLLSNLEHSPQLAHQP